MKKRILVALALVLLTFSSIPVMAADSPTGAPVYTITVNGTSVGKDGNSNITVNGGKISVGTVEIGKEVTLTATANPGSKFNGWDITGSYTVKSGDVTKDTTIVIIPNDEKVAVNAKFVTETTTNNDVTTVASNETTVAPDDVDEPDDEYADGDDNDGDDEETTVSTGSVDNSGTSPKTGVATGAILATLLVSGGIAATSRKKSK